MSFYVHALMQNADHLHRISLHAVENHVRADGSLAVAGADVIGRLTDS